MSTDLTDSPPVLAMSPMQMAYQLMQSGREVDPDIVKKFMEMEHDYATHQAAKVFAQAVTGFQSECPPVFKGRTAKAAGNFQGFDFASFDDVMRVAKPLLTKYAIVPTFTTETVEHGRGAEIKCTCRVRVGIHVEETAVTVPIPPSATAKPNDTHQYAQAVTYAKRYALCAALNIVCTNDDNDATPQVQYATTEQIAEINILIEQCADAGKPVTFDRFLKWLAVDNLENLDTAGVAKAVTELKSRLAATKKVRPS